MTESVFSNPLLAATFSSPLSIIHDIISHLSTLLPQNKIQMATCIVISSQSVFTGVVTAAIVLYTLSSCTDGSTIMISKNYR